MKTAELMYRDASNYKFFFEAEIPDNLKVGDELTYESLGFTRASFHKDIVKYKYNPDDDHNLLEVVEIKEED